MLTHTYADARVQFTAIQSLQRFAFLIFHSSVIPHVLLLLPLLERGTHEETGGVAEEAFRGEQEESRRNYLNTTPPDSS
jgi:hypothetical protein